jgi:hypothetical protein
MPLIEKEKKPVLKPVTIKLEESLADRLGAYCRFLDSSRDHVIAGVLSYVMGKDKDFAAFLSGRQPGAAQGKTLQKAKQAAS